MVVCICLRSQYMPKEKQGWVIAAVVQCNGTWLVWAINKDETVLLEEFERRAVRCWWWCRGGRHRCKYCTTE